PPLLPEAALTKHFSSARSHDCALELELTRTQNTKRIYYG
ncbi:MAG: hypothetical protein ACI8QF_004623, partial [Limisphaerales bacterium]